MDSEAAAAKIKEIQAKNDFEAHLKYADKVVKSWPLWKQNILKHSTSPTVSMPRKPIVNEDEYF